MEPRTASAPPPSLNEVLLRAQSDLDEGVAITRGARFEYVNEALCRLYGYSEAELKALPSVLSLVVPEDRGRITELMDRRSRGDTTRPRGEATVVRKDGRRLQVEWSGMQLDSSVPPRVFTIVRDVTERRKLEAAVARHVRDLERLNQDLEHFIYAVSHDLKDPLHTVRGFLDLLERKFKEQPDPEGHELVRYAKEGADWMRSLIDGLLAYGRLGVRRQEPQPVDMDAALDRALDNIESALTASGGTVERTPLPTVRGDPAQLTQLLQNLLSNAVKFRGPDPPFIQVRATRDGDAWRFEVEDNGIGIAPGQQDRLFKIFQRLHTEDEYPGTGIGLAIGRRIVELHGGTIGLRSEPGRGSTFWWTLPAERDGA